MKENVPEADACDKAGSYQNLITPVTSEHDEDEDQDYLDWNTLPAA